LETRIFAEAEMQDSADPGAGPLTRLLCLERRGAVMAAVADLPESYRVPLILRYYEELTYDEIAAALHLTRQNVAVLLFRAKKRLRQILAADGSFHGL
jgi:RNA polymerase sigma-70 factor (ECF subfamily)